MSNEEELQQYMFDAMECAAIEAITDYEEALLGTPGPDGEDPLTNWKPLGLLPTPGEIKIYGQHDKE